MHNIEIIASQTAGVTLALHVICVRSAASFCEDAGAACRRTGVAASVAGCIQCANPVFPFGGPSNATALRTAGTGGTAYVKMRG